MSKIVNKTVSLGISFFLVAIFAAPAAFAVNCDQDADGYIAITYNQMQEAVLDNLDYEDNGNSSPQEWKQRFDEYVRGLADNPNIGSELKCDNVNFKKGAEPLRCDSPSIAGNSGVFDSSIVSSVSGSKVNPGAFDVPNNGIDEDCDGADGKFVSVTGAGAGQDLGGLVQRTISLLSKAVVAISVIIMIWGGILYATAAGDEQKTSKAKKAIIGAIIGLAVGLLAPAIINYITASLG